MTDAERASITVSVVSHGQGGMVAMLLEDLARCSGLARVILTQNIPEGEIACPAPLRSRLTLLRNEQPRGFGANHNQAFQQCETRWFAVVNPDIRLPTDPFALLVAALEEGGCGVAAPEVRNPAGGVDDSVRRFPTLPGLVRRFVGKDDGRMVTKGTQPQNVDWAAGMFLLFSAGVFREVGGFDERYFLYYEDVDICVRLWRRGQRVVIHPGVAVVHAAQRASRRKLRYMAWHLSSMVRYFATQAWRLPQRRAEP